MVSNARPGAQLMCTYIVGLATGVNGVYVHPMTKDTRFEMRASDAWLKAVDDWRRKQADIPPRAEAIRRLVEVGIQAEKRSK